MKILRILILSALALVAQGHSAFAQCGLKNVIIMIADGWGYNQIQVADYWNGIPAVYETFPIRLPMATYSLSTVEDAPDHVPYDVTIVWTDFGYLLLRPTDSAAAATAMSTGVKSYDGQLNMDPVSQTPLFTALERAEELGKATGVITTVEWSHATPAGWVAHNVDRSSYTEIAQEMLASNCEVLMGCGHPYYNSSNTEILPHPTSPSAYQFVGGIASWNALESGTSDWTLIQDRSDFVSLGSDPNPPAKVCGVAKCRGTLQQARVPEEESDSFMPPYSFPRNNNVPSLAEMSQAALNVLDHADAADHGLFLMIEGGAVDWAGHSHQAGRLIEELDDFNAAVETVIEWVEANSNWNETLLIVAGDHETGYLWGENSGYPATWNPVVNNGFHVMPSAEFCSEGHSNSLIPFFAKGIGSAWFTTWATEGPDPLRGYYIDNTRIADICFGYFDCTLAVELLSFEATASADGIRLSWQTGSETNHDHFEILRNGSRFASIAGQGSDAGGHSYEWLDSEVLDGVAYTYTLTAIDRSGGQSELARGTVTMNSSTPAVIRTFALHQNHPNPFNPSTTIRIDVPESCAVTLKIYNSNGQHVANLADGIVAAGSHAVLFDGHNLPSGLYICRMESGRFMAATKMVLMR